MTKGFTLNIPGMSPLNVTQPQGVQVAQQAPTQENLLSMLGNILKPQPQGGQQMVQIDPQQAQRLLQAFSQGYPIQQNQVMPQIPTSPSVQGCIAANGSYEPKVKSPYVVEERTAANAAVGAGSDLFAASVTAMGFGTETTRQFLKYQGVRSAEVDNRFPYAVQPFFNAVLKDAAGFIDERMSNVFTRALYNAFVLAGYWGADDQFLFLSRVRCADLMNNPLRLKPYQLKQWTSTQHCFRLDQHGVGRNYIASILTTLQPITAEGITEVILDYGVKGWFADTEAEAMRKSKYGIWDPYTLDFEVPDGM